MIVLKQRSGRLGSLGPAIAPCLMLAGLVLSPLLNDTPQAADVPNPPGFRQVTIFGIMASPGRESIDPKLLQIDSELRKLKPGHGFKLRAVETRRLAAAEALACDLGQSLKANVRLLDPENAEGKVRLEFTLKSGDKVEFSTVVTTPPNQLFFCERPSTDEEVLLIGVGAR